jgi:cellulose synthase/poly-beta-1,6-N-acetylglucosamine synthase-like glycosyltransferase
MKELSVTVLVTAKNAAGTIKKCIESLMKLNYKNYKVYVTDAYSTDGTWNILKKLKKKYRKKLKIERVRGNIAKAHNYMIQRVKTKFIAMTDADCVVDKNWLRNLVSGFTSDDIVATAGFCSTPKTVNKLQKLMGMELEDRFKHFPEFISRAPTMNLCVRTNIAKKVRFDERFDVAQETDWGYRLTKLGKMRYVSNAVVYHFHRPTWKSFFIQQFRYGKYMPLLYLKHRRMATGDHISKPSMIFQEFVLLFFCSSIFLSLFFKSFLTLSGIMILFLFILYLIDILRITRNVHYVFSFLTLYTIRTIGWTLGLFIGIFKLLKTLLGKS